MIGYEQEEGGEHFAGLKIDPKLSFFFEYFNLETNYWV